MRTVCVRCGKSLEADSLDALSKLAASCCKKKGSKKQQAELAPPKPLNVILPYSIDVPCRLLSHNSFNWKHWSVYAGYKRKWLAMLAAPTAPLAGCRLMWSKWTIVRHYTKKQKEFDLANLVGGAKPVPDCLKNYGVIHDDAPKFFSCDYRQVQDGRDSTELILESIHNDTSTSTEVSGV